MLTLSRRNGTGGEAKKMPEDFVVREITSSGIILREDHACSPADTGETEAAAGNFTHFVLQKKNWDTVHALVTIAKRMGRGKKSIGYAGSKDKVSISVQLASIYGVTPQQVLQTRLKDISINGAWRSAAAVDLGSNLGNSFSAVIRGCVAPERIEGIVDELGGFMPNYFDRQRFGMRMNNADIGERIMRGEFEGAVMMFLTDTSNETNAVSVEARERLMSEMDFSKAREYFPRSLNNERMVIEYLSRYGGNYANALRKIPRGLLMMFIHSVQSRLFNDVLEERIRDGNLDSDRGCGKNFYGFPDISSVSAGKGFDFAVANLIGYETKPEHLDEYEKKAMERAGLSTQDMRIKQMPELSVKGSCRTLLAPVKDPSYSIEESSELKVCFSIPSGSYATIFLGEITKSKPAMASSKA